MGTFGALILLIIVVATYGLLKGNLRMQTLYSENMKISQHVSAMKEAIQQEGVVTAALYINRYASDDYQVLLNELAEAESAMRTGLAGCLEVSVDTSALNRVSSLYTTGYAESKKAMLIYLQQGQLEQALFKLEEISQSRNQILERLQILETDNNKEIQSVIADAKLAFKKQFIYTIPILILTALIIIDQSSRMKRFISDRISKIAKAADQIADGHIDVTLEVSGLDEIGILACAFNKMIDGVLMRILLGYLCKRLSKTSTLLCWS